MDGGGFVWQLGCVGVLACAHTLALAPAREASKSVTDSYKLGVAPHWLGALARGARGHLKLDQNSVLLLKLCVVQPDKRSL